MTNLSAALKSNVWRVGVGTIFQNSLVFKLAAGSMAVSPIPSGAIANINLSATSEGVVLGANLSLYWHFSTGKIYFTWGAETGVAPFGLVKRLGRTQIPTFDVDPTYGFAWNVNNPESDLWGPSWSATIPKLFYNQLDRFDPFLPPRKGVNVLLSKVAKYVFTQGRKVKSGIPKQRPGTLTVNVVPGGPAMVMFGHRGYSWGATAGFTFGVHEVLDLNDIVNLIRRKWPALPMATATLTGLVDDAMQSLKAMPRR